tara:strand:- start:377 stop:1525 length:1149 start_codon:yes stop_codon:yes gene_type:complete
MMFSPLYTNNTSRRLLILLMTVHILGTIVAYTVYIKLASLGDGYLPKDFPEAMRQGMYGSGFGRTMVTHAIYYYVGSFLPGVLAPLVLGQIVAIATWHAFRDVYSQINRKLFWICNLFPHFLIWTGSSSKEQILMIFGIFVIGFATKHFFVVRKLTFMSLFLVCFSLAYIYFIRPNYFPIYFTIFLTSLFAPMLNKAKIYKLSVGVWAFIFSLITMLAIFFTSIFTSFFSKDFILYMKKVEVHFLDLPGRSNRYNIQWETISDFFYNSLWGIPQGFIGPTFAETFSKPILFPVFLEGIVYLFILCYLFAKLLKLAYASNKLRVYILPYFFVALVIIFLSYPLGIFNPGSALRYKQSMHPVLFFYPLLIMTYARVNNLIRKKQ